MGFYMGSGIPKRVQLRNSTNTFKPGTNNMLYLLLKWYWLYSSSSGHNCGTCDQSVRAAPFSGTY